MPEDVDEIAKRMRERYENVDLFGGDCYDAGRWGLVALMSAISEECWCASWLNNNEYALWKIAGGSEYGQGIISDRQARLLADLSAEAGGWFRWDGSRGLVFMSTEEWLAHLVEVSPSSDKQ